MAIQVLGGLMEKTEGWLIAKTSADGQYRTLRIRIGSNMLASTLSLYLSLSFFSCLLEG